MLLVFSSQKDRDKFYDLVLEQPGTCSSLVVMDNQGYGLETRANVADATPVILPDTLYLEPCNITSKIFQHLVFTYFKQEQQHLWNFRLLTCFKKLKTNAE